MCICLITNFTFENPLISQWQGTFLPLPHESQPRSWSQILTHAFLLYLNKLKNLMHHKIRNMQEKKNPSSSIFSLKYLLLLTGELHAKQSKNTKKEMCWGEGVVIYLQFLLHSYIDIRIIFECTIELNHMRMAT